MQPEPATVSQNETTENNSNETRTSTQYGLHDIQQTVSPSSADNAGTRTASATSAEQVADDAALAAFLQQGSDILAQSSRRLSARTTPSPPSGRNRVTEYEKASTPPTRKKDGPGFEVIKKYRSPSDRRSPIQELPNGESHIYFCTGDVAN